MKIIAAVFVFIFVTVCGASAFALQADEIMADPVQERRAVEIGSALRCVVCQSESINDSQADMARDLRRLVRQKIAEGQSDDAIMAYVRDRYGDYILLRPPVQQNTLLLWLTPVILLGGGFVTMVLHLRRQQRSGRDEA